MAGQKTPKKPSPNEGEGEKGLLHQPLPWWAKAMIGVCGIVIIYKYTPIFELLNLFFMIVVVPAVTIGCMIFGVSGLASGIKGTWEQAKAEIKARVEEKVDKAAA